MQQDAPVTLHIKKLMILLHLSRIFLFDVHYTQNFWKCLGAAAYTS